MPGLRLALALHGSGSDAEFARSAFRADDLGVDAVVALDDRTGDVEAVITAIDDHRDRLERAGDRVALVAGISLGAHAAARWASGPTGSVEGLVLALPAWTGPGGQVALATRAAADEVAAVGSAAVLDRLHEAAPDDWVVRALRESWPRYGDALAPALRAAGAGAGPTLPELRAIPVPCAVVALDGDPLHPRAVAEEWVAAIPRATLTALPRDLGGQGPSAIGRAGGRALRTATGG